MSLETPTSKRQIGSDNLILHIQCFRVIEKEMSEDLLKYFSNTEVLRHAGGHFVPATGEQKKAFVAFFEKMQTTFA